jgi:hypothetical protein
MDKRMNDDPARFNGIKQTVPGRADHEAAHRFFEQRRDFRMRAEILKRCVEFVNNCSPAP